MIFNLFQFGVLIYKVSFGQFKANPNSFIPYFVVTNSNHSIKIPVALRYL